MAAETGEPLDFSTYPCSGRVCFRRLLVARRACTRDEHECPYEAATNENSSYRCRCCADCQRECSSDI